MVEIDKIYIHELWQISFPAVVYSIATWCISMIQRLSSHTCFELEKMVTNRINGFRPEQYTMYNIRHYFAYLYIRCTAPSDIPLTESKTWSRFLILRVSFFSKIRPFYTAVRKKGRNEAKQVWRLTGRQDCRQECRQEGMQADRQPGRYEGMQVGMQAGRNVGRQAGW